MLAPRATPYRWLGATATHTQDRNTVPLLQSLTALCDQHPHLQVIVNFFDKEKVDATAVVQQHSNSSNQVEGTWVPGMKTLFWHKYLTPERTQHLDFVWVFDCDIAVHPSTFPLGQLAGILKASRATVLQPSIQALVHGTFHPWLRVRKAHMSCLATTAQWVEMQTPLFAGDAWAAFHRKVLSIIPEEGLATSDFGLDIIWCAFLREAFPKRPTCLVTPSFSATHLNSHAIEAYMSREVMIKERSCTTTCKTLYENFRSYWKNFSHHTGECYAVSGHHGLIRTRSHYAIDGDGMIRARHGHGGYIGGMYSEPPPEETEEALMHTVRSMPRGVGAVSLENGDRRLGLLSAMLHQLCEATPGLRVVINLQDKHAETNGAKSGRKADVSLDNRISTTWINGPRSLFWKRILTGRLLSDPIDYVWLFDATLAVHPTVNPLLQLSHMLAKTEASVAFPRVRSVNSPADPSMVSANGPSCAAYVVRTVPLAPSVVFKAEAWKHFHGAVLSKISDDRLSSLEPGFEELVCGTMFQRWGERTNRPACVAAHVSSMQLGTWKDLAAEAAAHRRGCPESSCAGPLRRMYPVAFNASVHDDDRCWMATPKGLESNRKRGPSSRMAKGKGRG